MRLIKILSFLEAIINALIILSLTGMILVVMLQIIARFFFPVTPPWTEELARFFFIYLVSFGSGIAVKEKAYVNVDFLINHLPERLKKWNELFILLSIAFIMTIMMVKALDFIKLGAIQQSPSIDVKMSLIYSSMFIMPLLILVYVVVELIQAFRKLF